MVQPADIKHVAKLAKLSFDDSKIDAFTEEFNAIIDFVEQLEQGDTQGVAPTYHGNLINGFREDKAQAGVERELLLANVKTSKDGFIQVPAIMESEEA